MDKDKIIKRIVSIQKELKSLKALIQETQCLHEHIIMVPEENPTNPSPITKYRVECENCGEYLPIKTISKKIR